MSRAIAASDTASSRPHSRVRQTCRRSAASAASGGRGGYGRPRGGPAPGTGADRRRGGRHRATSSAAPPNHLELAMYAVMWSEHCSYKSSRIHLRRLPTEGECGARRARARTPASSTSATASPPPSASRATTTRRPSSPTRARPPASGGILRDIFTMGARPIALMDPLRFGPLDDARSRWIAEGVVTGISGYGNSVGVPDRRRRGRLRRDLRRQPAGQRAVPRRAARRAARARPGVGRRQPGRAARLDHRARRHRRRQRAGLGRLRRGRRRRRQAPAACRSATRSRRSA